jgi:hypothetical protein
MAKKTQYTPIHYFASGFVLASMYFVYVFLLIPKL